MQLNLDKWFKLICFLCAAFLVFLFGGIATYFEYPPYGIIYEADAGYRAMQEKEKIFKKTIRQGEESDKKNILNKNKILNVNGAFQGYTFTSYAHNQAVLIDMDGKIVHKWKKKYSEIWPDPPHINNPLPDSSVKWRDGVLTPNGDIIVVTSVIGDTPYGYGLAKLDKDSNVIWKYDAHTHHSVSVGLNGNIHVLTQDLIRPDNTELKFADRMILADSVSVLDPDGKEIKRISLIDALAKSGYKDILMKRIANKVPKGDILHANSVVRLDSNLADKFPMFKEGQLLISLRNINFIGVLDIDYEKFTWGTTGIWKRQHDAEFTSDGKILLFDNKGAGKNYSRIIAYDPVANVSKVVYGGIKSEKFRTNVCGMQQQLPNGNLFIVEAQSRRMFEVTPDKKVVWKAIVPVYMHCDIQFAYRYAKSDLNFLENN